MTTDKDWKDTVINACVLTECCLVESDPEQSLRNLIDWHTQLAKEDMVSVWELIKLRNAMNDVIGKPTFSPPPRPSLLTWFRDWRIAIKVAWKYRNVDPDVCGCGQDMNYCTPGVTCSGECLSLKQYLYEQEIRKCLLDSK